MAKKPEPAERPEGFTEEFINFWNAITPKTKINMNDVEEMRRRFANYINAVKFYGMEFDNPTAYFAIGLTPDQVSRYTNQRYAENPERGDFLRGVRSLMAGWRTQNIAKGYIDPKAGMFWQQNFDGLQAVSKVEIAERNDNDEIRDIKQIASRYQDVIDVEFTKKETPKIATSQKEPAKAKQNEENTQK